MFELLRQEVIVYIGGIVDNQFSSSFHIKLLKFMQCLTKNTKIFSRSTNIVMTSDWLLFNAK